mgnify:CR=1
MAAKIVSARFYAASSDEIDITIEEFLEFGFDAIERAKSWASVWVKLHHYVNVAIGAEVVTKYGAE